MKTFTIKSFPEKKNLKRKQWQVYILTTNESISGKAKLKIKIEKFYDINFYIFPKKLEIKNQYCACVCMYLYIYICCMRYLQ